MGEVKRETKSGKLSLGTTSGDLNSQQEVQSGQKKVIDPHDVVTTDVLSHLLASNHISDSVREAQFGGLILIKGTLLLVDRLMFDFGLSAYEQIVLAETKKRKAEQNHELIETWKLMQPLISKVQIPSGFLLRLDDGTLVCGTVKELGMEEPVTSFYFQYGSSGLSNVYVAGIKQSHKEEFSLASEGLPLREK